MTRREVRVADSFFARLDHQLRPERGPNGEASATDFIVIDLPTIVEEFATSFDELAEAVPGVATASCISWPSTSNPEPQISALLRTPTLEIDRGIESCCG